MRLRQYTDLFIALGILLPSTVIAVYAYAAAAKLERPISALMTGIKVGETNHTILAGELCPGEITSKLVIASMYGLRSSGTLRTQYGTTPFDAKFNVELYFNPIRQLAKGDLHISGGNLNLDISATNTNPVKLAINASGAFNFSRNLEIPGPILLVKDVEDRYLVDYGAAPLSSSPLLYSFFENFTKNHQLTLIENTSQNPHCNASQLDRLDITPLVSGLASAIAPASALIQQNIGAIP